MKMVLGIADDCRDPHLKSETLFKDACYRDQLKFSRDFDSALQTRLGRQKAWSS